MNKAVLIGAGALIGIVAYRAWFNAQVKKDFQNNTVRYSQDLGNGCTQWSLFNNDKFGNSFFTVCDNVGNGSPGLLSLHI